MGILGGERVEDLGVGVERSGILRHAVALVVESVTTQHGELEDRPATPNAPLSSSVVIG